jgi:hypothetical protein
MKRLRVEYAPRGTSIGETPIRRAGSPSQTEPVARRGDKSMQNHNILPTIILSCFYLFAGCNSPTATTDPAILNTLCKTVAAEDADNNGITAAGTPWNLSDLTTEPSSIT